MQVFISWSGDQSRQVAVALRDWLPGVINSIDPFVSSKDIHAGSRWQVEVADRLDATNFGIVCVTRANQMSGWLNFEAGALAKSVQLGRVVPLAVDLKPSDIKPPLGQFQAQPATEEGIGEVLNSLNASCGNPLDDALLKRSMEVWWPDLECQLAVLTKTPVGSGTEGPERSERELLEELLDTVRVLGRADGNEGVWRNDDLVFAFEAWRHAVGETEIAMAVRAGLAELPDDERKVVALVHEGRVSAPAAARRLGMSVTEVRRLRAQALERVGQAVITSQGRGGGLTWGDLGR